MTAINSDINLARYENLNSSHGTHSQNPSLNFLSAVDFPLPAKQTIQSDETKMQVPAHLAAMYSLAEGYCGYINYLKCGGHSGVDHVLGSLELIG